MKTKILLEAPLLLILAFFVAGLITTSIVGLWGLTFIVISVVLLFFCLRKFPATPPYVGLVTIWGERKPVIKKEGWRILAPFPPFMIDGIPVNVEKKNKDFHPKDVRTLEQAELEIEISVTWTPDKDTGENLIEYINAGGRENVENILDDIIEEKIREFAIDKGWQDCLRAKADIAKVLIKEITGIEEDIQITQIRRGNGLAKIPSLGIVLNRLNIGTMKPKGKLAEESERIALEQREMEAEAIELKHVKERTKELQEVGLSAKDAVEIVQTERGKVKKEIKEYKGFRDIGEGFGETLGKIFRK